jgi:hypothetical protein
MMAPLLGKPENKKLLQSRYEGMSIEKLKNA